MKKLRIGFDIDDVLIYSADALAQVSNSIYGTNLNRSHNYNLTDQAVKDWKVEDANGILHRIHDILPMPEWLEAAAPIEGALEVLSKLQKEDCQLFAVTGRPAFLRESTLAALEKCYPGIFSDETLYMTDIFGLDGSPAEKVSKLDIARRLELTHFVEDYLVHADVLGEGGIKTVLFSEDYHWNKTGGHPSLIRASNWKEVGEFFENERRA